MRIRRLPETTANRIAAGEVVERPAAAVKELVENALDAGATRLRIAIEGGGIDRILVEDDGAGMGVDDLALCIERHATSKLAEEGLLFRIATLGFRGEALPSIGAVARLAITSRLPGAPAHAITVEGGHVGAVAPAAGAPGTRVEVRDLFFATPARRKFLKSPRAEAEAVTDAVKRLAMGWPEVAFSLEVDGRATLTLPAADRAQRLRDLLGPDFAAAAVPVEGVQDGLDIEGFVALPSHTRATAAEQHLVVNRRPVRDPLLRVALRVAFRDVIAYGRHPVGAIFLTLPPEAVDVNVHPMKTELRFLRPDGVRGALISAVRRALAQGAGGEAAVPAMVAGLAETQLAYAGGGPRSAPWSAGRAEAWAQPQAASWAQPQAASWAQPRLGMPMPPPALAPAWEAPELGHPLGRAIAQLMETYIVAEAPDGALILVDQHAAHERLTQEALGAQRREGSVRTQPLLIPAVVELPQADAARLVEAAPMLAGLGLEIEGFGAGAVLVRAMPALLGAPEPAPLLRDLAEELAEWDSAMALERRLDAAIARLACHGSIRAGRRLAPAEMDALLRQMEATPRANTCSHGRPTWLKLDKAAFEKMFGRR
ncbi:DNA mismatch repair endonuclease MutL [Plastoroseomonas arctica]|uniref:DNA mismatch repair protein MutL n=1 Tax=Plastoroseomonas arctica TaxID=1509237 RepID=A0AAF1JV27_9PROT|nr:DNA mismatch repair endonuclease MutL [Plastoroseomonas arctica]MBR0654322.1 DNA mismatch repair endonuclease MutL [Plastoroseomonas arctica]